jgi:homoserine kinase type II
MSVFTKVSHDELIAFLSQYPVGELVGFQGIGEGVENTNYFVDTADGRWVLTLFERLNHADLPFFLGLMAHLADAGFPGAAPLRSRAGDALMTLNGKPAALVRRLAGQWELFPHAEQCAQVGRVLAQLHLVGQTYGGRCENSRGAGWRRRTGLALLPEVDGPAHALIESELAAQATLDLSALPQGIIHADLFKDNVLFVERRLSGVIDFYYACNDALVYDLAVAVNDWCFSTAGQFQLDRFSALVEGYRQLRPPTAAECAAWPLVVRAAAFRFYLSRLQDWVHPRAGDLVHIKDPEPYRQILEWHRQGRTPPLPAP